MVPPLTTTKTYSVNIKFYTSYSSSTPLPNYVVTLIDDRSVFHIHSNHNVANEKMFVQIDESNTSNKLKPLEIQPGKTTIGSQNESEICDYTFDFQPSQSYSLKIYLEKNDLEPPVTYYGKFTYGSAGQVDSNGNQVGDKVDLNAYSFLYRSEKDFFEFEGGNASRVVNIENVENGGSLIIYAPIVFNNTDDSRTPHTLSFKFDEADDYPGTANDSDNNEGTVDVNWVPPPRRDYRPDGMYTLSFIPLSNDSLYQVYVIAYYNDGYTLSYTLPMKLPVIALPVIQSINAYGLPPNKTGTGDSSFIATVMEVTMQEDSAAKKLGTADNFGSGDVRNNSILFQFKQGNVVHYEVRKPIQDSSSLYAIVRDDMGDLIPDGENASNLIKVNGVYPFTICAVLEYINPNNPTDPSSNVIKTSVGTPATFTQDINSLPSFNIQNAWVSASVTTVNGERMVDLTNATSNEGYSAAPICGIVGSFQKHAFYGSGVVDGIFKDLDTIDTKHKFQLTKYDSQENAIPNSTVNVTQLVQMQGNLSKTSQENFIDLIKLGSSVVSNSNGLYDNIPGEANVTGSSQPPIYFWIPMSTGLYTETDNVKVSIQIVVSDANNKAAIPDPTESIVFPGQQVPTRQSLGVVNKVNRYTMELGTPSEPRYLGSGNTGQLEIPIINSTTLPDGNYYFTSATFTSSTTTPSPVTELLTSPGNADGVFDLSVENPSRGSCTYTVHYNIADPNGTVIRGPLSDEYTIPIENTPTEVNFNINDSFSYKTFNNDGESGFSFTIEFINTNEQSIDGVNVYFESASDFVSDGVANTSQFFLVKIPWDKTKTNQNVSYTLQSTDPLTSGVNDGVKILGNNVLSSALWKNYGVGKIVIEPYITRDVVNANLEEIAFPEFSLKKDIYNVPVISKVENIALTGGVVELHGTNATYMTFDNALSMYAGVSSVTATYVLTLNNQDKSNDIVNDTRYNIELGSPVGSELDIDIKVKVKTDDNIEYFSQSVILIFASVSVDTSTMSVTVNRGSNNTSMLLTRGDYTVFPLHLLNVEEVKLVNNTERNNTNPTDSSVYVFDGTDIQLNVNSENLTYSIPNTYTLGTTLYLQYRVKAGVKYYVTLDRNNRGSTINSVAGYLPLSPLFFSPPSFPSPTFYTPVPSYSANVKAYVVATRPEVTIVSLNQDPLSPSLLSELKLKVNAKGLKQEGVQSIFVLLGQDGDYTNALDNGNGVQIALSFTASNVDKTYAILNPVSENINVGEHATLSTNDLNGLYEGSGLTLTWQLQSGSLDENDVTTLIIPSDSGFVSSKETNVVVVASTRLGVDVDIKKFDRLAL